MTPSIAFVFPGQGSQSVGMGRAFYDAVPGVRKVYEEAAAVLGYDVAALCFDGPSDRLNLTEYTQPALLTASIAAHALVTRDRESGATERLVPLEVELF